MSQAVEVLEEESQRLAVARVEAVASDLADYFLGALHPPLPEADATALREVLVARARGKIGGEVLMAYQRAVRVAPDGTAHLDPERFAVQVDLQQDGTYGARLLDDMTEQRRRCGRVAWVAFFARFRKYRGIAPEEHAYLEKLEAQDEEQEITDATMLTVDHLFAKLQEGYNDIISADGREAILTQERTHGRATAKRLLQGAATAPLLALERGLLEEVGRRADEDLSPPVLAEVARIHEQVLLRAQREEASTRLVVVLQHMLTSKHNLSPQEQRIAQGISAKHQQGAPFTHFQMRDLELLWRKATRA